MIKKVIILTLILFFSNLNAPKIFAAANPFSDVPASHWAYNSVTLLASKGIIEGYGDATFRGNRNITRYEAVTIAAKIAALAGIDPKLGKETPFSDVTKDHWAYSSVKFTYDAKINNGYGDHTFRGNRNVTRYEMAQMFNNILKTKGNLSQANKNPFSDVPNDHWAYDAVMVLANEGIIEGYGDATFHGNRNITRYEAAVMIARTAALLLSL